MHLLFDVQISFATLQEGEPAVLVGHVDATIRQALNDSPRSKAIKSKAKRAVVSIGNSACASVYFLHHAMVQSSDPNLLVDNTYSCWSLTARFIKSSYMCSPQS